MDSNSGSATCWLTTLDKLLNLLEPQRLTLGWCSSCGLARCLAHSRHSGNGSYYDCWISNLSPLFLFREMGGWGLLVYSQIETMNQARKSCFCEFDEKLYFWTDSDGENHLVNFKIHWKGPRLRWEPTWTSPVVSLSSCELSLLFILPSVIYILLCAGICLYLRQCLI